MSRINRRFPQNKRHTKPCKFFQINSCPLTEVECNFLHIKAEVATEQGKKFGKVFARAGQNGARDNYWQDGDGGKKLRLELSLSPKALALGRDEFYRNNPFMYGGYSPCWSPDLYTPSPGLYTPGLPAKSIEEYILTSPSSGSATDTSVDSPICPSLECDDGGSAVTEDPQYTEHSHTHQSKVQIEQDYPLVHVPPIPHINKDSTAMASLNGLHGQSLFSLNSGGLAPTLPQCRNRIRSTSRQKAASFKTKPCKFYRTDRGCPNGTSCTFIHDGDILDSMASQRVPQGSTPRNYFPVRWRVIGGGVLVGSASTNPEDVTEQALDDEQDDEQLHLAACSAFPSSTPRPIEQAKIKQAKPNFTSTRKRSNSFPTQPTASFISKKHLFSAEYPDNI